MVWEYHTKRTNVAIAWEYHTKRVSKNTSSTKLTQHFGQDCIADK